MVGVAVWDLKNQPAPLAQDVSTLQGALKGSSPSPTDGQNNTTDAGGSQTPSSAAPGSSSEPDPATVVEQYYGLLPGNTDAAWGMLSFDAQAASGGREAFDTFWQGIAAVSLENVQTVGQGTVEATVNFTRTDGSWTKEQYRMFVSHSGGQPVMQSFSRLRVAASGGSPSGGSPVVGIVDLSAVSSDPRALVIGQVLDSYFSGINQRDWARAVSALDSHVVDSSDPNQMATFERGESTTNDSNVVVQSINENSDAPSGLSATVTLQSRQDPSLGPDGQACTLWNLEYLFSGTEGSTEGSFLYIYKTRGSHTAC